MSFATSHGSPLLSWQRRQKSLEVRMCRKLPAAPREPMSRSEVCSFITCSKTCSGPLLHRNRTPNLPTDGCSQRPQGETGTVGAVQPFAIAHIETLVWWSFGGSQETSHACLPRIQLCTGSGATFWRPPDPRLSTCPGLSSQPILLCWGLTDTDSSSISWWDKNHPPYCSQPSSQSL